MTSVAAKIRARNEALYARAIKGLTRKKTGGFDDDELHNAMAALLRENIDPDHIASQRAAAVLENLARVPGSDGDDDGPGGLQLSLFGDHYGYNPLRLIKGPDNTIIEEERATLPFMMADLARSTENARRAMIWNNRKVQQAQHLQQWTDQQRELGRPAADLTWGNCVRETGLLRERPEAA
jgi:hypothetical protein